MNEFRYDAHEPRRIIWTTALISGIIGALLVVIAVRFTGLGTALVSPPVAREQPLPPPAQMQPVVNNIDPLSMERQTIDVVKQVGQSVVMITTSSVVRSFDFFTGFESRSVQGLGSGVVYSSNGYILTNNHVVNGLPGTKDKIMVIMFNKEYPKGKSYPARVVGADSRTDLAVLKIDATNLPVPRWADSNQVQVGQTAIAIGNPLTESLNNTVTVGVVSAKERTLEVDNNVELPNMIQTDASINPGNSGGPLLDSSGRIIGINTAIAPNSQGIGFAIPSNTAKAVAQQLISRGYVSYPGIGLVYIPLDEETVAQLEGNLGVRLPVDRGLFIYKVIPGAPAALAGLRAGDIIVKLNGERILDRDLVREAIARHRVGDKLTLEYYRGNNLCKSTVRIAELGSRIGELRQ